MCDPEELQHLDNLIYDSACLYTAAGKAPLHVSTRAAASVKLPALMEPLIRVLINQTFHSDDDADLSYLGGVVTQSSKRSLC